MDRPRELVLHGLGDVLEAEQLFVTMLPKAVAGAPSCKPEDLGESAFRWFEASPAITHEARCDAPAKTARSIAAKPFETRARLPGYQPRGTLARGDDGVVTLLGDLCRRSGSGGRVLRQSPGRSATSCAGRGPCGRR